MKVDKASYFEEIYQANKDKIYRLCRGFTADSEDTKDLFQEVLIRVWNSLDSFREESKISTWVYRVATNTALTYVKQKSRRQKKFTDTPLEQLEKPEVNQEADKEAQIQHLYEAIAQLQEIDRIIISLLLEGCSYKDIAEITGLETNHIGVKINRIKKHLKKRYQYG